MPAKPRRRDEVQDVMVVAAVQAVLVFPALLFMTALVVRYVPLVGDEPAQTAQRIVMWYSGRTWTLWGLLLALPSAVLISGCLTLLHPPPELPFPAGPSSPARWAHPAALSVAAATLAAAGILVIVVLHMLAN